MSEMNSSIGIESEFVHAVARAGRAFHSKKRHSPIKEGSALASYLRSDRPLEVDEREMLTELVLGHLCKSKTIPSDSDFAIAVKCAGRAFIFSKNRLPKEEGIPLANYLRSERPVASGEREMLAEFSLGEWRSPPHRKVIVPNSRAVVEVVETYQRLLAETNNSVRLKDITKGDTAKELGISKSKVEKYLKIKNDRELIEKKYESKCPNGKYSSWSKKCT